VLDRFGKDVMVVPDGDDHFTVTVKAFLSPVFYAWLFSFGSRIAILSPESLKTAFLSIL
jgi:hypothetical protein